MRSAVAEVEMTMPNMFSPRSNPGAWVYLEVGCTYNLLSNCSYNPVISPITIVTLDLNWVITIVTK